MKKWQKKVAVVLMSIGLGFYILNTPIAQAEFNPPEEIVQMEHYF